MEHESDEDLKDISIKADENSVDMGGILLTPSQARQISRDLEEAARTAEEFGYQRTQRSLRALARKYRNDVAPF